MGSCRISNRRKEDSSVSSSSRMSRRSGKRFSTELRARITLQLYLNLIYHELVDSYHELVVRLRNIIYLQNPSGPSKPAPALSTQGVNWLPFLRSSREPASAPHACRRLSFPSSVATRSRVYLRLSRNYARVLQTGIHHYFLYFCAFTVIYIEYILVLLVE